MNIDSSNWRLESIPFMKNNPDSSFNYFANRSLEQIYSEFNDPMMKEYGINNLRVIQCDGGKIINTLTIQDVKRIIKLKNI